MDIKQFRRSTRYNLEKRIKVHKYLKANRKCKNGQTVMIGDSIVELFDVRLLDGKCKGKTEIYNRGISGDTSDRLLERLEKNLFNLEPRHVIVLIGTNDLSRDIDEKYVLENIKRLCTMLKENVPNARLTVQCLYPVNRKMYNCLENRNDKINSLNEMIKACAENEGFDVLDFTGSFKDENGELDERYTDDGLHPNRAGFEKAAENISKII